MITASTQSRKTWWVVVITFDWSSDGSLHTHDRDRADAKASYENLATAIDGQDAKTLPTRHSTTIGDQELLSDVQTGQPLCVSVC